MSVDNYLTCDEIHNMGIKKFGNNLKISKKASLYNCDQMEFGDDVRIDDFCVLSGRLVFGSNVFIGCFSLLAGADEGIYFGDYTTFAYRVSAFTRSDDYSGETLTNSTIPEEFRYRTTKKAIHIKKHSIVGAGTIILPGGHIEEGVSVGAASLVTKPTEAWGLYFGTPARRMRDKEKGLLEQERAYISMKHIPRGGGGI